MSQLMISGAKMNTTVPATTTATIEIINRRRSSPRCSKTVMRPSGSLCLRMGTGRIRRVRWVRPAQGSGAASMPRGSQELRPRPRQPAQPSGPSGSQAKQPLDLRPPASSGNSLLQNLFGR